MPAIQPLLIKCMGRGHRQMCFTDKYGFPKKWRQRRKVYFGFQTGDIARVHALTGKHKGIHTGRVTVKANGAFDLATKEEPKCSINWKYFTALQRQDGYAYTHLNFPDAPLQRGAS